MPFSMKQVVFGSEILVAVLEEALKAGVDSIRLEYEDTGLGVNFFSGELGSLVGIVPRDREQDILASLIEKANGSDLYRNLPAGRPDPQDRRKQAGCFELSFLRASLRRGQDGR